MKKVFVISIVAVILYSCNGSQEKLELQAQVDSLTTVNASQTQQLKEITDFMSIVSEGLDSIAEQEQMILNNDKGVEGRRIGKKEREELKNRLESFAALLTRQKDRIAQLEDSLAKKGENLSSLHNIITHLNRQLEEKNKTIASLRASVENQKVDINKLRNQVKTLITSNDTLTKEVGRQGAALMTQSEIINTCYVKIGTKKELSDAGILTGGGFLKKKKLDVSNFNQAEFTKVDITTYVEVQIPSKKIEILTQMPTSSYNITHEGNTSTLHITDPNIFWSVSNYLVIQIK